MPPGPPSPLIGREEPLASLRAVLATREGRHGAALLIGETGMGKTRLLDEAAAAVPGVLRVRARLGDRLVPFSTLGRFVRALCQHVPSACDAAAAREWALLLQRQGPASAGAPPGPPRAATALRVLRRAAGAVSAWMLDDLHLADEASTEFWLALLQAAPAHPLPWIISSAPPAAGSVTEVLLEAAAAGERVRTVLLPALDATALFDWILREGPAGLRATHAHAWATRLLQETEGVPLHMMLLMQGWAPRLPPTAADPADSETLPAVLPLIGERLAELGAPALQVARAASVAGQDTSTALLAALTGQEASHVAAALEAMTDLGLWSHGDFAHERMREAARAATPDAIALRWHAGCARWLALHGGEPARQAAHWQAAGEPLQAVPALQAAAERARQLGATADRLACLAQAARLAELHRLDDVAFSCCSAAFEAHTEAIRHTDGASLLAQMDRLARTPAQHAAVDAHRCWYAMVHGELEAAIEHGEAALAAAEASHDDALLGPARLHLGTSLGMAGHLRRALDLLAAAQPWADAHLPPVEQASALGNRAALHDNLGQAEAARALHRRALGLALRHGDGPLQATLLGNYALGRLDAGDPLGAVELVAKARRRLGDEAAHAALAGFIATVEAGGLRALGRYADALAACDRAESRLASHNAPRLPVVLMERANIWLDLGHAERARSLIDGAGQAVARQLPPRHAARWWILLARVHQRLGLDTATVLQRAHAALPPEGWPGLVLALQTQIVLDRPGPDAGLRLADIAERAEAQALPAVALGAWLPCALLAGTGARDVALAWRAAQAAMAAMGQGVEAPTADRALRWLAPARALMAAGQPERAADLLRRGQAWLSRAVAHDVPPGSRQDFLEGHPLNLALRECPVPA